MIVVYERIKEIVGQQDRGIVYGVWSVALHGTFMAGAGWRSEGCLE